MRSGLRHLSRGRLEIRPALEMFFDVPRKLHRLQIELFQKRIEVYFLNFFWFDRWSTFSDIPPCQLLKVVPFLSLRLLLVLVPSSSL